MNLSTLSCGNLTINVQSDYKAVGSRAQAPPPPNNGSSRKHPYLPHRGNWMLTPLPPSDVLIHLLLSETFFLPSPSGLQKFPPRGECGSFLERPNFHLYKQNTRVPPPPPPNIDLLQTTLNYHMWYSFCIINTKVKIRLNIDQRLISGVAGWVK